MKIAAIIQARCGSTRFPNKVFADLCGHPLIWHVVNRLRFASTVDEIVLATTINFGDQKLYDWGIKNNITVFRGSENDVLNRYYRASEEVNADIVIRITADDPFKEPSIIDKAVQKLLKEGADFVCNNFPPSFPEGLDVEVFTKRALSIAEQNSESNFEREHVTQYFYHNPSLFKILNISNHKNLSGLRWTLDTEEDFLMTRQIYSLLYKDDSSIFYMDDILDLLERFPEISRMNLGVTRSEMYKLK